MILNLYLYKGNTLSMIGPWVAGAYFVKDESLTYEEQVPVTQKLSDNRIDLHRYPFINYHTFNFRYIHSYEINAYGELAVYNAFNNLINYYKSIAIKHDKELIINYVINPFTWYEKTLIIACSFYRKQYLKAKSEHIHCNIDYLYLDSDVNFYKHIELLITYKVLPPLYILDKCTNYFYDIYPKPLWWFKEQNALNKLKEFL